MAPKFATVDEYLGSLPDESREILENVRRTIHDVLPEAGEKISYQMPTITLDGQSLVYFAAWKHHIGLYPIPVADEPLEQELAPYRAAKDTVRLPLAKPIPYDLIGKVVNLLVQRRRAGET